MPKCFSAGMLTQGIQRAVTHIVSCGCSGSWSSCHTTSHRWENREDLKFGVWVQQHQKPQLLSSALQHHERRTPASCKPVCVSACPTHQYKPVCMSYTPTSTVPRLRCLLTASRLMHNPDTAPQAASGQSGCSSLFS